jgi:hypothetical protein
MRVGKSRDIYNYCGVLFAGRPSVAPSRYQVIDGTRIFTQVDQARDVATFGPECGGTQALLPVLNLEILRRNLQKR